MAGGGFLNSWVFSPLAGVTFGDWARLMAGHGSAISPRYWPRTAFTTAMSIGNSLLAARERRRFGPAMEQAAVTAPVFVLGHHRSGTTHLWNLLSTNPAFAYPTVLQAVFPHSFLTFEAPVRRLAARFTPKTRPQDNVGMSPDSPLEEERAICTSTFLSIQMARHFPRREERFRPYLTMRDAAAAERERWKAALDEFGRKLLVRYGGEKTLLFKAPDHTAKIALIRELYPDARFIHIHRDPYAVFVSTRRMEMASRPFYYYQRPDPSALDDFILWRYRAMYDAYTEDAALLPTGRLVEIGFRDLERDPVGTVARIYRELGLPGWKAAEPALRSYVRSVADYRKNDHPALPEAVRARVADTWRPAFERWGYAA